MNSNRRNFLKGAGAAAAQSMLAGAGLTSLSYSRNAYAAGDWGALPSDVAWPGRPEGYKILEIYLQGGASQWETFWLGATGNRIDFTRFDLHSSDDHPGLNDLIWQERASSFTCLADKLPSDGNGERDSLSDTGNYKQFALPSHPYHTQPAVYWGPAAKPIFDRNDIYNRARMVTQWHNLDPHEAARPFCLTGLTLGNPRLAGTGAAIQRRSRTTEPQNKLPVSYILHRDASLAASEAAATGDHPGSSRPIVIRLGTDDEFYDGLSRGSARGEHEFESDKLLAALRQQYRGQMHHSEAPRELVRSSGFNSYWTAAELLASAPSLRNLFRPGMLRIDENEVVGCPFLNGAPVSQNKPAIKTMLEAAAPLLEEDRAKYVCCADVGIVGTYDTHGDPVIETNTNIYNVLFHLANVIHHPLNNPRGTLNLDETMVVITTEFGRTPSIVTGRGRDHWPDGHACYLFGGPIPEDRPTIQGNISRSTGETLTLYRYSFTDFRGALLLAAGVDPFAEGNFRYGDFSEALKGSYIEDGSERDKQYLRSRMKRLVLGVE